MRIDPAQELTEKMLCHRVGDYATPVEPALFMDFTVAQAIKVAKLQHPHRRIRYFYVVDRENKLVGLVTTKDLLFSDPDVIVEEILYTEVVAVRASATLRESLEVVSYYQLPSLAVIDSSGRFLGVIEIFAKDPPAERPSHKALAMLYRDIYQFIGFSIEQHKWNSPWRGFKVRMPWLFCNLFAGLICALIGLLFQQSLVQYVVLALFIPLVLTLCESVATQSMTLTLQILHKSKQSKKPIRRRLKTEIKTVFLMGAVSSVAVAIASLLWRTPLPVMAVICLAVLLSMVAASVYGTVLPFLVNKKGLDPRVASGPLILMCADISATTIYLGISSWWLLH